MSDKTPASPNDSAGKSGRVVHDARGNAVWNWVEDDARPSIDSTTHLLKRLELPELQIEDTQSREQLDPEAERCPGGASTHMVAHPPAAHRRETAA